MSNPQRFDDSLILIVVISAVAALLLAYNVYQAVLLPWYWQRYLPRLIRKLQQQGNQKGALQLMENALTRYHPEKTPGFAHYLQHLYAQALYQSGQPGDALRHLRPLQSHYKYRRNRASLHIDMARSLSALGKEANANEERDLALKNLAQYGDFASRFLTGQTLFQEKRYAEACTAFEEGLQALPRNRSQLAANYLLEYAYSLYYTNRFTECIDVASRAIRLGETGIRLLQGNYISALAAERAKDRAAARHAFREAAILAQKWPTYLYPAWSRSAMLCALDGDADDMRHCLTEAEKTEANRFDTAALKASLFDIWVDSLEAEEALAEAEALLEQESGENRSGRQRWLILIRLWSSLRRENTEKVRAELDDYEALYGEEKVVESARLSDRTRAAIHLWLDTMQSPAISQEEVRERIERIAATPEQEEIPASLYQDPQATIYALLTLSALRCDLYDLGLQLAEEYRSHTQNSPILMPTYYYTVGECLAGQGKAAEARQAWQQAIAIGQKTWDARRAYARLATTD